MPRKSINDRIGECHGFSTILREACGSVANKRRVVCLCRCGCEYSVLLQSLLSGNTKSCGCHRKAVATEASTTHGQDGSGVYRSWQGMLQRCNCPSNISYQNYGGRGIVVSACWQIFENFYKDMGDRPSGCSLDRIDNNGPYCKENCRWATRKEQNNNKRNSALITYDGESLTISQWSDRVGLQYSTLHRRLRCGWSVEAALTTPLRGHK